MKAFFALRSSSSLLRGAAWRRHGGGGGGDPSPLWFFFLFSPFACQKSVMYVDHDDTPIPSWYMSPHKKCVTSPSTLSPLLNDFFSRLAAQTTQHRGISPPLTKHPGTGPGCMYIMYIHMYVCMYVGMYVFRYVFMYVCICVCVCMYLCLCMYVGMYGWMYYVCVCM